MSNLISLPLQGLEHCKRTLEESVTPSSTPIFQAVAIVRCFFSGPPAAAPRASRLDRRGDSNMATFEGRLRRTTLIPPPGPPLRWTPIVLPPGVFQGAIESPPREITAPPCSRATNFLRKTWVMRAFEIAGVWKAAGRETTPLISILVSVSKAMG